MKFNRIKSILLIILLSAFSCAKETIQPTWSPLTINQQRGNRPYSVSIPIEELDIDEFGSDIGDVPVVGGIFQQLATMFADIAIDDENGTEIEVEPTIFSFPELAQVDFDLVKNLQVDGVQLRVEESEKRSEATLSFIKRVEVYITFYRDVLDPSEVPGGPGNADGTGSGGNDTDVAPPIPYPNDNKSNESFLILSYDKETDEEALGCLTRCLDLTVHPVDWKGMLERNRTFKIETKLIVDSVPKIDMKLGGKVDVSVFLETGF